MGVPALFRWLSKKYPKIIYPVQEEEDVKIPDENNEIIVIPPNMADPNPNGTEFDNLYLDMNGIVHPCTHPEGKPAPETEEEMMVEIFKYTERVVNMVRPRKLLFMAIDGVAPRAKMNQQRSRRFRAAQEAKEKEEARKESLVLWKAMGKEITDDMESKEAWDSNAITPGTPFMSLLAASLRYWVVSKMNSDPGWKNIQVIISDASVPGEGEHKIMDWIRCQRANPGHDPNTRHVIYGLDADLIMLALATHEPHFRVLREDVFGESNSNACRTCGQEGHFAAQCTADKAQIQKKPKATSEKKPFIFLDVTILREYLENELNIPQAPFPFDLERSIDDWVMLIFFVGNDFLPHLPSLEIREGAIDTLLRIWKQELPRMGGYLTNHGSLELSRVQIILEGLAKREDEIFRKRREAEERQESNAKRRKLEEENKKNGFASGPSPALGLTASTSSLTSNTSLSSLPSIPSIHPSLPPRPDFIPDFAAKADSIGLGVKPTAESIQNVPAAAQALAGSNHDVVANRRAIRMANMSAAEVLKAELAGLVPVKPSASSTTTKTNDSSKAAADVPNLTFPEPAGSSTSTSTATISPKTEMSSSVTATSSTSHDATGMNVDSNDDNDDIPGFGAHSTVVETSTSTEAVADVPMAESSAITDGNNGHAIDAEHNVSVGAGVKRKLDELEADDSATGTPADTEADVSVVAAPEDEDEEPPADGPKSSSSLAYKVNADGTVLQEDTVKLWESGYRERYYRQKFGVEYTDVEFRKGITKSYIEGMAWVLCYYYQGTPSWQWYYPYHFAPFAADFEDVDKMDIKFELGRPFKPYEQLMGVFPAASRKHIPEPFHFLMTEEDSPIIDFYPSTFEIDMNGKRMAWQGVALLPFIDPTRLLDAMKEPYGKLTEDEVWRNTWGNNSIFTSNEHPIHPSYEQLYGKRRPEEPIAMDVKLSKGISGSVLPNPDCLPGSTYLSPLIEQNLPDIKNDSSLSVFYFFPKQITPHRSVLLPGLTRPPRMLSDGDLEYSRNGGRGGRGRGGRGPGGGGRDFDRDRGGRDRGGRNDPFHSRPSNYGNDRGNNRGNSRDSYQGSPSFGSGGDNYGRGRGGSGGRGGGGYSNHPREPSSNSYQGHSNYGGGGGNYGNRGRGGGGGGGRPPPMYGDYSAPPPAPTNFQNNGYGGNRGAPPPPAPPPNNSYSGGPGYGYGGYGESTGTYGGGGGGGSGSSYGGYGGYGNGQSGGYAAPSYGNNNYYPPNNYGNGGGGYNNAPPPRNGSYNPAPSRGRGRGW